MELTGRITADATIRTLKDDRKVVHFSIAVNDRYKPKGAAEWTTMTTFIRCSCWSREGVAKYLTKGTLVEVHGRIGVNAWVNEHGEAKANLNFHVNNLKIHGRTNFSSKQAASTGDTITEPIDDLPF